MSLIQTGQAQVAGNRERVARFEKKSGLPLPVSGASSSVLAMYHGNNLPCSISSR